MYEEIFRSTTRPFRATPDTKFYYPHESIDVALKTSLRAVERAEGPVVVMGGAGLGKSLLADLVASDLSGNFDIVRLSAARLCSRRALLQNILFELGLPYRELSEGELRLSLLDRLEPNPALPPEGIVIVVDEAHTLPEKLLEELRLITNFTRENQPRARLVLIGGMQLEDVFAKPQMESFNQRLAARCYLSPMDRQQTSDYIEHQIRLAGFQPNEFLTSEAQRAVYAASEGVPRLVNQVMDHTLVLAITNRQCPASASLVEQAWADLQQLPLPWQTAADRQQTPLLAQGDSNIEFGSLDDEEGDAGSGVDFELPLRTAPAIAETMEVNSESDIPTEKKPVKKSATTTEEEKTDAATISRAAAQSLFSFVDASFQDGGHVEATSDSVPLAAACDSFTFEETSLQDSEPSMQDYSASTQYETIEADNPRADTEQNNFFAAFTEPDPGELPVDGDSLPLPKESLSGTIPPSGFELIPSDDLAKHLLNLDSDIDLTNIDIDVPTVLPSDSFFSDRETDEKLLAIKEEQNQFADLISCQHDRMAKSEDIDAEGDQAVIRLSPNNSTAESLVDEQPPTNRPTTKFQVKAVSACELFGDDFEEEFPIEQSLRHREKREAALQPRDASIEICQNVTASSTSTGEEIEPEKLKPNDAASETVPLADDKPAAEQNILTGSPNLNPWSVDVLATEDEAQSELQQEMDNLISQLNFSSQAEDFSIEQINVDSQPDRNSQKATQKASSKKREHIQTDDASITRNDGQESGADQSNLFGTHWSSYEDDRDLLIIDEELPSRSLKTETKPQAKAKRMSYTQLFAKLRK